MFPLLRSVFWGLMLPEGGIFVMITVSTFKVQLINLVKGQR